MKTPKTAREILTSHCEASMRRIESLEREIMSLQNGIDDASKLLPFTSCATCDSELVGGWESAEDVRDFSKIYLGKNTMTCPVCDRNAVVLLTVKEWNRALAQGHSERLADRIVTQIMEKVA